MSIGKSVTIEDLELYVPSDEKDGSKIRSSKSYYRGSKIPLHTKKSRTYQFFLSNDTTLTQLEEMTQNPYFSAVPIYDMPKRINTGFIESFSRTWKYGVSNVSLQMAHGYGKFLFIQDTIERPLHDRWRILISEDFSTDTDWNDNADIAATPFTSTGDADQIQSIPWDDISGDWESDSDWDNHLSGDNCLLHNDDVAAMLVAGWEWWENYEVEVWFYCDDSIADDTGIIFRYVDSTHHYRFMNTAASSIGLYNNATAILVDTSLTLSTDTYYHMKVRVQGHRIQCLLNGEEIFDHIDTTYTSGLAGMYSALNNTYFDNFKVTLLPPANFNLPASVDWTNQYSVADINTAHGTQKQLIAPDNNVQFKQSRAGADCILHLPMNEGQGTPKDHSKENCTILNYGGDWYNDKEKGWCMKFDESDEEYLTVNIDGLLDSATEVTINFDFYLPTGADGYFITLWKDSNQRFRIYGTPTALVFYNDLNNADECTTYNYGADTWRRITLIISSNGIFIFIDKLLVWFSNSVGDTVADCDPDYFVLGRSSPTGTNYGDCRVKNLRIFDSSRWDVALNFDSTPATVFLHDTNQFDPDVDYPDDSNCKLLWHCDEGSGSTVYDASGNGVDGTITGLDWADTSFRGEAGTCLSSAGDSDDEKIQSAASAPLKTSIGTISFWFKYDNPFDATPEGYQNIFYLYSIDGQEFIRIVLNADRMYVAYEDANVEEWQFYVAFDDVANAGKWFYVTLVQNGTAPALYLNAILQTQSWGTEIDKTKWTGDWANNPIMRAFEANELGDLEGDMDEIRYFSKALSANEITARYRSEPYLHDYYQMTRVYDKSHQFKGLPIISNGLIMLSFPDYDVYEERVGNTLLPAVYGWYENSWHLLGHIETYFYINGVNRYSTFECESTNWEIVELTDQYCKIRLSYRDIDGTGLPEGTVYSINLIIKNGYPGILFEMDDRNWLDYKPGIIFVPQYWFGIGIVDRFLYMPEDQLYDGVIEVGDMGRNTSEVDDNWLIMFPSPNDSNAPNKNRIIGLFGDHTHDDNNTDDCWLGSYSVSKWVYLWNLKNKFGGIFFVPYDVDDLFRIADTTETGITGDGQDDQNDIAGGTQSDGEYKLDNTLEYVQCQIDAATNLPKGTYMAIARVSSSLGAGNRDGIINVDNDNDRDGDLATKSFAIAAANTWEIQYLSFYTDGTNDVYISIECFEAADEVYVDYFVCIPLANDYNFPSNLAHSAFSETNLLRGLKK